MENTLGELMGHSIRNNKGRIATSLTPSLLQIKGFRRYTFLTRNPGRDRPRYKKKCGSVIGSSLFHHSGSQMVSLGSHLDDYGFLLDFIQ